MDRASLSKNKLVWVFESLFVTIYWIWSRLKVYQTIIVTVLINSLFQCFSTTILVNSFACSKKSSSLVLHCFLSEILILCLIWSFHSLYLRFNFFDADSRNFVQFVLLPQNRHLLGPFESVTFNLRLYCRYWGQHQLTLVNEKGLASTLL